MPARVELDAEVGDAPAARGPEGDGMEGGGMGLKRCAACARPVTIRWRRCPWCRGWTGLPHHPSHPVVDRRLDGFRAFGAALALWTGFGAVLVGMEHPLLGAAVAAYAVAQLLAHLLLAWHPVGWKVAEGLWALGALALGLALLRDPVAATAALVPAGALLAMRLYRERALARLGGLPADASFRSDVPRPGPCTWCGERASEIVAPLYCISAGWLTWRFPGKLRNLCAWHARAAAVPALVTSALLGWWGLPWGIIWTPQVLLRDLDTGGAIMGSRELDELRSAEALEGGSDWAGALGLVAGLIVVPICLAVVLLPRLPRLLM